MTRAELLVAGGAVAITAALLYRPREPIGGTVVLHVPVRVAVEKKPEAHRGALGNLVAPPVKPETVYVSGKQTDSRAVAFCAAAARDTVHDTTAVHDTVITTPATLVLDAGRFDGQRLELYGFRSDASAYRAIFRARAPLEFGTDADSAWVRQRRRLRLPEPLKLLTAVGLGIAGCALAH